MNKDITITITQNSEQIISATITQCGGQPASEYLALIKLLSNQIRGELDADAADIDLSIDDALAYRTGITKLSSAATKTAAKFACTGCVALAAVDLPALETIGDYAFARCALTGEFLKSFPAAKSIGHSAFDRCNFESVDLSGVETIGARTFRAQNIRKVWIPQGLKIAPELGTVLDAPFIDNENVNIMIYTDCPDEATAAANWGEYFDNISAEQKAPVIYGATHDEYLQD